jgi:hypothetical protein
MYVLFINEEFFLDTRKTRFIHNCDDKISYSFLPDQIRRIGHLYILLLYELYLYCVMSVIYTGGISIMFISNEVYKN